MIRKITSNERGYEDGLNRKEKLDLDLDSLPQRVKQEQLGIKAHMRLMLPVI